LSKSSKLIIFGAIAIGIVAAALLSFFDIETSPTKEGVASACVNYMNSAEEYLNTYIDTNSSESVIAEKEAKMLLEAKIASNYVDKFSELDSGYSDLAKLFEKASMNGPGFPSHELDMTELFQSCDKIFQEVNGKN